MSLQDLKYKTVAGGYLVTGWNGDPDELVIPEGVVEIGEGALERCTLTELRLPSSLRRIGRRAFARCPFLKEITFPSSGRLTEIGPQAFLECDELEEVCLPATLQAVGDAAFASCYALIRARIPACIATVGEEIFGWCYGLKVTVEGTAIPRAWPKNWNGSEDGTTVLTGVAPKKAAPAPQVAAAPLETAKKPPQKVAPAPKTAPTPPRTTARATPTPAAAPGPTNAARKPFAVPGQNAVSNATPAPKAEPRKASGYTPLSMLVTEPCEGGLRLVKEAGETLTELILPPEITEIGKDAFNCNPRLRKFKAGPTLKYIGNKAFRYCHSLYDVEIALNTAVADQAFQGCAMTHARVTPWMQAAVFHGSRVRTAEFCTVNGYDVSEIRDSFFAHSRLERILIPDSVTLLSNFVFSYCQELKMVTGCKNVSYMGPGVFQGCASLQSVVMPKEVGGVPRRTFYFCEQLQKITISPKPGAIDEEAFYACHALEEVRIPNHIYCIREGAFFCQSLKRVIFEGRRFDELKNILRQGWIVKNRDQRVQLVCVDKTVEL